MKISIRVVLIGFVFLALYGTGSMYYLIHSLETLYDAKYTEVAKRMEREANVLISEKLEAVLLMGIVASKNENVKNFLLQTTSKDLELDRYARLIKENTSMKNVWFHVVDKKGVSRYRSWTKERGDSLVHIRKDLAQMIKNPKMSAVISAGKFDMTFKSMVPIYDEGRFIGSIETIARFNSIVKKLQRDNFETVVLVDKSYKNQLTHTAQNSFIGDYFISAFSGSHRLMQSLQERGVEHFTNIKNYSLDSKNEMLFSLHRFPDIHGKNMGYFIMAIALEDIDILNIQDSKNRIILSLLLGFLIISGFLLYLYIVNYKKFIEEQQRKLEESVQQKTKELRVKSEEMTHLAHHDSLTNLPNRLLFEEKLDKAIAKAKNTKTEVGVLFLDLDGFKEINDTYGHKTGDQLLQAITLRLKRIVRNSDVVARLGGDEFTIIVENSTNESLEKIANKIIIEIQKSIVIDTLELFVTFSIGISVYPSDGADSELLLKYADTAMYKAKEDGKNRYQFYNYTMTEITLERLTLQNALRDAISLGQFEPYFQPKIDANSAKVIGLEALVRWIHPEKGMIAPYHFIPFAEESGLIKEIDQFMLSATLKQIKAWHSQGITTGRVSVNISTKQLQDFVCIECFEETIARYGFDPAFLEVEVTESQIMKNQKKSIEVLKQLKGLGITISMDDFGTGYSSLSYLKNLPVDRLKIDRSFIIEIPDNQEDAAIVKTIIVLAKNLGLDIIAEGVETKEQLEFLVENGCHKIQGYYYSKPLSAEDCEEFLRENMQKA